ncbi:MAG: electron transport complex subunit RsxD [Gammaproteobacteria bacterium]
MPLSSPFIFARNSVTRMMLWVVLALLPGIIAQVAFFGWGVLINAGIAIATAVLCESLVLYWRQRPIAISLLDGSALVTALLLAISLPPLTPWWIPFLGTAFAIIIAKHLYGGLGYNPFNPAMVGYAMLLIAFPREMTAWLPPLSLAPAPLSPGELWHYSLNGALPAPLSLDAVTAASPLDLLKTQAQLEQGIPVVLQQSSQWFGSLAGVGWEWINIWFLIGGLVLLARRVISWHIPLAMLAGLGIMAGIFHWLDPNLHASPLFHLFSGATMLGAFFIATDPVTAATTVRGRLIYGALIGVLLYVIRQWGSYPDAVAFAVLLINMTVPTIDYYTRPRVFGEGQGGPQ